MKSSNTNINRYAYYQNVMHYSAHRGYRSNAMFKCDILRSIFRATLWNAAEFLGSILHHANSFSMLWVRVAIGIRWHCNALQIVNMLTVTVIKGATKGGPGLLPPQIECCLALLSNNNEQVLYFQANFSWDMSTMRYFSNKFTRFWWSEVAWFGEILLFHPDYDETLKNHLWRHFSDITAITSPKNVTKLKSQDFLCWAPPNKNFWLCEWL